MSENELEVEAEDDKYVAVIDTVHKEAESFPGRADIVSEEEAHRVVDALIEAFDLVPEDEDIPDVVDTIPHGGFVIPGGFIQYEWTEEEAQEVVNELYEQFGVLPDEWKEEPIHDFEKPSSSYSGNTQTFSTRTNGLGTSTNDLVDELSEDDETDADSADADVTVEVYANLNPIAERLEDAADALRGD